MLQVIHVSGNSLEEIFENSAHALFGKIYNKKISSKKIKKIKIIAKDRKSLLLGFIEELLYLLEAGNFYTKDIKNILIMGVPHVQGTRKFYNLELRANLHGDDAPPNLKYPHLSQPIIIKEVAGKEQKFIAEISIHS